MAKEDENNLNSWEIFEIVKKEEYLPTYEWELRKKRLNPYKENFGKVRISNWQETAIDRK